MFILIKTITFIDKDNNVILSVKVTALPLKEDYILKKSKEYFNCDEPCMIYRSSILKRFIIEFEDYWDLNFIGKNKVFRNNLPNYLIEPINLATYFEYIKFK